MSSFQNHSGLRDNGFRRITGNTQAGYILVSEARDGRKVYIDQKLSVQFAEFLTTNSYKGQRVLSQLAQLRSKAGGLKSFSNSNDAFEHMDIVENLQIGYKILQPSSDNHMSGVYITYIAFAEHASGHLKPGLYPVNYDKDAEEWGIKGDKNAKDNPKITRTNVAINGLCSRAEVAAKDILPDIVNGAYKEVKGSQAIREEGFEMYYNPRPYYTKGKEWTTPEQKQTSQKYAADKLANLLLDAQKGSIAVQWVIHGDGSKLLKQALQRLQGQKLDKHTMFFAAPTETMTGLLPLVRKAGINLHKDVMKFNAHDWSQPKNRLDPRIKGEIAAFGEGYGSAAAEFAQRLQRDIPAAAGWGTLAATGGGLGLGALGKARALRNMSANHANDPALNPHMHPFKGVDAMNAHISQNSGGELRSFMQLAKSLCREWA